MAGVQSITTGDRDQSLGSGLTPLESGTFLKVCHFNSPSYESVQSV